MSLESIDSPLSCPTNRTFFSVKFLLNDLLSFRWAQPHTEESNGTEEAREMSDILHKSWCREMPFWWYSWEITTTSRTMKSFKSGIALSCFSLSFVRSKLHALVIVTLTFHLILNQFCFVDVLRVLQCDSKKGVLAQCDFHSNSQFSSH